MEQGQGAPSLSGLRSPVSYIDGGLILGKMDSLREAWDELDKEFGLPHRKDKKQRGRQSGPTITIPKSSSLSSMKELSNANVLETCNIEGMEEDPSLKGEYCKRLAAIIADVPSVKSVETQTSLELDLPKAATEDIKEHPDLSLPFKLPPSSSEPVYTFGVFDIRNRLLQQRLCVLGNQSLKELRECIYCHQNAVGYSPQGASFFFVENTFYGDEGSDEVINNLINWMRPAPIAPIIPPIAAVPPSTASNPNSSSKSSSTGKRNRTLDASNAVLANLMLQQLTAAPNLPIYTKKRQRLVRPSQQSQLQPPPPPSSSSSSSLPVPTAPSSGAFPHVAAPFFGSNPYASSSSSVAAMPATFSPFCQIDPFALQSQPMGSKTIQSIPWQRGRMYLFCHHHSCEHLLALIDIQYPVPTPPLPMTTPSPAPAAEPHTSSSALYPFESYRARFRTKKCEICCALNADFVTFHDRLASAHGETHTIATFYCRACLQMLHYGVDGRPLDSHRDDLIILPFAHFC